ncbi:Thiol-disulfide isomerase or thioredoxin [Reichenbachiella faecimaris]|uniref:Thiol-disulfide isomerase or thioredoxin n=1 Tax=Reichenbachiella faecimaris TaxID=692418 RepID=A0A1W2G7Y8_REIFA|nr:TlpA family protein disulfide reductase [Reichenbachiella faecimaris]SMD32542.1 Thiol-disulfide isomerase or thioredoxin [Reichenbachiella faecimaris]
MKIIFLSCLIAVLAIGCSSPKNNTESSNETATESEKFAPPPNENYFMQGTDGTYYYLEELKGKKVFINYWATWCKPCIAEMPDIQAAAEILEKEGYVFFLVSDQEMDKIMKFEKDKEFNLTFAKLNGKIQDLKIQSLPTTEIYTTTGKRVQKIAGAVKWDSEGMLKSLRAVE